MLGRFLTPEYQTSSGKEIEICGAAEVRCGQGTCMYMLHCSKLVTSALAGIKVWAHKRCAIQASPCTFVKFSLSQDFKVAAGYNLRKT